MDRLNQKNKLHKITICTSCRHTGSNCQPGTDLIRKLQHGMDHACDGLGDDFEISGIACVAGCNRPCTVAYHATRKASYLFGDINTDQHIEDLVAFARQYAELENGWCSATSRPEGLSGKTLARIPSTIIQLSSNEETLQ